MYPGKSSIIRPSYHQGFARSAGESKNPGLWKGLIGAWAPFLGVTGNRLVDQSPYKNHGTLVNMDPATDWVIGRDGWALDFDGGGDRIVVGNDSSLDTVNFTVAAWVKSDVAQSGTFTSIIAGGVNYILYFDHANLDFQGCVTFRVGGSTFYNSDGPVAISENTWHHIVGTYDGTFLRFYLDGTEATSRNVGSLTPETGRNLHIATDLGKTQDFDGLIDNIYIYNRALSAAEIAQLYYNPQAMFERAISPVFFVPPFVGGTIQDLIGAGIIPFLR